MKFLDWNAFQKPQGGGKGGGGGGSTQVKIPKFELAERQDLLAKGNEDFALGPREYFPGETVAGFNPNQIQGQNMLLQQAGGGGNLPYGFGGTPGFLGNTAQDVATQGLDPRLFGGVSGADFTRQMAAEGGPGARFLGLTGESPGSIGGVPGSVGSTNNAGFIPGLDFGQLGVSPAMQQALQVNPDIANDPTVAPLLNEIERRGNENLMENILPQAVTLQQQAGQGSFSTKGELLRAQAMQRNQREILGAQAGLLGQARGQELDAQSKALATLPGAQSGFLQGQQAGFIPGQMFGQVGGQQQAQSQLGIDADINRFNFGQQANDVNLDELINRQTQAMGMGGRATVQDGSGSSNPIAGAAGGALLGHGVSQLPMFATGAAAGTTAGSLAAWNPYLALGGGILGALFG